MITLRITFIGLTITSSWGNGHATTYRGLAKELGRLGHQVTFLERNVPWYAEHRDVLGPQVGRICLYDDLDDLKLRLSEPVVDADVVIVGSYVPEGASVLRYVMDRARGIVAFYDIDTPITLAKLDRGEVDYVAADQLPHLDLYLSFAGGPLLARIRRDFGVSNTQPLYCSVDPEVHRPVPVPPLWDLGYLGTYSDDRQPKVECLLNQPAARLTDLRFVVAGPQYPSSVYWPDNVERIEHLSPEQHPHFYNAQRFTLNVTRADMVAAGWSPSVRLFEAAACGTPIISDDWPGLETFFRDREEILVARSAEEVVAALVELPEAERRSIAEAARQRVLVQHTATCRAKELERHLLDLLTPTGRGREGEHGEEQHAKV